MSPCGEMTEHSVSDIFSSAVLSLKQIVTIVTGLAITNAIIQLMLHDITINDNKIIYDYGLINVNIYTCLLFIIVISNVIRFYHGNIRHLDDLVLNRDGKIAINFFIIFTENILFAILSFSLQIPNQFFCIFIALIFLDIVWFELSTKITANPKTFERRKKWTLNNILFIIIMLVILVFSLYCPSQEYVLYFLFSLFGNTIADFYIQWNFYFPKST